MRRPLRYKLAQNRDKARRDNFWKIKYKPTKWNEKDRGESEHVRESLLDLDYSQVFEHSCSKYKHYFEVVSEDLGAGTN